MAGLPVWSTMREARDADDAAMPAIAIHNDAAGFREAGFVEAGRDFGEHGGFRQRGAPD